jgi:hypothetical protein
MNEFAPHMNPVAYEPLQFVYLGLTTYYHSEPILGHCVQGPRYSFIRALDLTLLQIPH